MISKPLIYLTIITLQISLLNCVENTKHSDKFQNKTQQPTLIPNYQKSSIQEYSHISSIGSSLQPTTPKHQLVSFTVETSRLPQKKSQQEIFAQLSITKGFLKRFLAEESNLESIRLYNFCNAQYTIKIHVGQEKIPFKVILDTGSDVSLQITSKCQTKSCQQHKQWSADKNAILIKSNEKRLLGNDFKRIGEINYEMGFIKYQTEFDDYYIGEILVKNQSFGGVIDEKYVFSQSNFDGLLGLGYPLLGGNGQGIDPFFDNIIKQKLQQKNQFGLFISRNPNLESKFWLGGIDYNYIKNGDPSNINYHKVAQKTWWSQRLTKILINGIDTGLCGSFNSPDIFISKNCLIILDTGSTVMSAPKNQFEDFQKAITKQQGNNFEDDLTQWPKLTFVIDEVEYSMENYEYLLVNGALTYQKTSTYADKLELGFIPWVNGSQYEDVWIAGDMFLSKYVFLFDRDSDRVGIVEPDYKRITQYQ